jgi:hypothetical protein
VGINGSTVFAAGGIVAEAVLAMTMRPPRTDVSIAAMRFSASVIFWLYS